VTIIPQRAKLVALLAAVVAAVLLFTSSGNDIVKSEPSIAGVVADVQEVPVPLPAQPSAFTTEGFGTVPETLVQHEVEVSARAEAPSDYIGPDGRRARLRYKQPSTDPREVAAEMKRKRLLAEMQADPQRFAALHGFNVKEVRWMVDGEAEIPEALLLR
jgi:hypothetical protein